MMTCDVVLYYLPVPKDEFLAVLLAFSVISFVRRLMLCSACAPGLLSLSV